MFRGTGVTGLVGVMVLLIGVGRLEGETVFGNFGPGDSYNTVIGYGVTSPPAFDSDIDVAMPFVVPAGLPFWFTSVDMALDNDLGSSGTQLDVYLMTNEGGKPGTVIETLQIVLPAAYSQGVRSGTASGTSLLSPGTTYWLAASATLPDSKFAWKFASPRVTDVVARQIDLGGWNIWITPSEQSAFRVLGSPVPEPSTVVVLATGVVSLLFMAWRRRRRR